MVKNYAQRSDLVNVDIKYVTAERQWRFSVVYPEGDIYKGYLEASGDQTQDMVKISAMIARDAYYHGCTDTDHKFYCD